MTVTIDGTSGITYPAGTIQGTGYGPAVFAEANSDQNVTTDTFTKVTLSNEIFDTANCFTNSRFTPNVAGYYQVNGVIRALAGSGNLGVVIAAIYKNGSLYSQCILTGTPVCSSISAVAYMNGTTDYLELYGYASGTSPYFDYFSAYNTSQFSAAMLRGA